MGKEELLRKIIREEVSKALKQELPKLIAESLRIKKEQTTKKPFVYESTLIPKKTQVLPEKNKKSGNIIKDILNETKIEMQRSQDWETINFNTDNMGAFTGPQMVPTAQQPVMIQGDEFYSPLNSTVPDFNSLMDKMITNGVIK